MIPPTTLDHEARQICRSKVESLEQWLRRLVDETLRDSFGTSYETAVDAQGHPLLGAKRIRDATARRQRDPARYVRIVDAFVLGDLVDLICNKQLWVHFRPALTNAYPDGAQEARTFLKRIEGSRNKLAHANAMSPREMEQVVCYSNDVIESLMDRTPFSGRHEAR